MLARIAVLLALGAALVAPATAAATPVADNDPEYGVLGRVFPDPLGGCQRIGRTPCSPNAQGNVPAEQFIGFEEFIDGIQYLNSKPEWQRHLEVLPLDGRMGANEGDEGPAADPAGAFPGNNLPSFGFTPRAEYRSVGLPTTGRGRQRSDLYMLRVTDETVPDAGKKRYALSLSIHGIERAGVEGGTRAVEDLVTAFTTGRADESIVPDGTVANAPTFADVLKKAIIYFTYPNPDGWRRGSVSEGGVFFQRYNGNGVDLNRDWPDVGFAFRPYSALSEPESRALSTTLREIGARDRFDAGADLHGQLTADALSYTLLGHGRHDWAKDTRVRETARAIHVVSEKALDWSVRIAPNDTPREELACSDAFGLTACARVYGQTWGTVYDTINYTTTGALGDWLDSPVGLNADGIDNEMSFSHLDRNIVFDPEGEQLHVDGNKALIYAQLSQIINPPAQGYDAPGLKGYVANSRLRRDEQDLQDEPPPGTVAQAKISGRSGTPEGATQVIIPFDVKLGRQPADGSPDAGKDVFNGGLRVDITKLNAAGISDGNAVTTLKVQCKGCDDHPGVPVDNDGFITVAEDFNQSPIYAQAGLTAAVNKPLAKNREGNKVEWRALLESETPNVLDGGAVMDVEFSQGPATASRDTSGVNPPRLAGYDIANTDVFEDLNGNIADPDQRFRSLDPAEVAAGRQSLDSFTSIVLADQDIRSDGFLDRLRDWVRGGGNLVLTDGSARLLPEVTGVNARSVAARKQYVGQMSFMTKEGEDDAATIKDPLLTSPITVAQDGARYNSGLRRQTFEPTPLGFAIQFSESSDEDDIDAGDDRAESPAWDVDRKAFERAGGRTVATAVESGPNGQDPELDRTALGEIPVGAGRVRFIGALLPQPSQEFDHDFGLEPFALTYTGHILLRNALQWPARPIRAEAGGPAASPGAGSPAPETRAPIACQASARGFRSVSVRGAGRRRLRVGFTRRVRRPVTVDVFQTSSGRRILGERRVARFRNKSKSFTWNGRANVRGRRVTNGVFFVRMRMRVGGGRSDVRRITLRRRSGRFVRRPAHYRKGRCSLLYKLERPVFGGPTNQAALASFRLTQAAEVGLTVMRGRKVVRRYRSRGRRAGQTYRMRFDAERRPRGDYRFVLTVRAPGRQATRARLTARRL